MANSRLCSIPDCGKPTCSGRGWCKAHYLRWHRHGDPLGGSTPRGTSVGSPLRYFNEVVLSYEGDDCLTWPYALDGRGYGKLGANDHVHRRVCEEHRGPPPTPEHEAAHSCGRGHEACCTKRHLSWKTPAENQADRIAHGTDGRGERNSAVKLTETQVRAIRGLKGKATQRSVADRYGVGQAAISNIQNRKRWDWLD